MADVAPVSDHFEICLNTKPTIAKYWKSLNMTFWKWYPQMTGFVQFEVVKSLKRIVNWLIDMQYTFE